MNFIRHDFCPATDLSPSDFGQTGFGSLDAPAFIAAGFTVWWHTFRSYHRGKQRKFNQLQKRLRKRSRYQFNNEGVPPCPNCSN